MSRIPPNQRVREAIDALLAEGAEGEADIASALIRLGAQRVIQELLEQEATDHLERSHYERAEAGAPHRGYRNGYKQRHIHTAPVFMARRGATVNSCRRCGDTKAWAAGRAMTIKQMISQRTVGRACCH